MRGRHIMAGYWNRPEATAETIIDGWLHTGDIAVRDAEGFIYIQDRIKDLIISGGENVYPAEIEDVLLSHPGIADVSVVAMRSVKWGESPLAVVVRADPDLDEAAVLAHSTGKLARFKQPKRAVFIDVIPRAATGKALKRLLREQFPLIAPEQSNLHGADEMPSEHTTAPASSAMLNATQTSISIRCCARVYGHSKHGADIAGRPGPLPTRHDPRRQGRCLPLARL